MPRTGFGPSSELIGSARESSEVNRRRAPSGPVKVLVTDRPHRRVDLTSGASALLAWFPASWASKIAPKLLENAPENAQKPQEINITCPKRSCDETPVEGTKQLLQAVKFAAKNMPGFRLGLDEDFQMAGCFQELIHGYTSGLVEPHRMGLHLKNGKKQPHCAHLIGLPTTVCCDCGIPMGACIKR